MSNSNRKLGLLPGSVVYTGENPNYNITVTVIYYSKTFHKRVVFSADDKIDIDLEFDGNIWINIDGINDVGLIKRIGKIFNIDSLSLEDIANPEQRVKIDDRDSYIHIILKMLQMELLTKDVQYEQMSLIIKDNILITFQETPYDLFESIRSRLENPRTKLASKDVSYLAYILIDTIVDNYLLILVTTPAPTVRPPSRIAKFKPCSIAIGASNLTLKVTVSPGITISLSLGNSTSPVTSVVRK